MLRYFSMPQYLTKVKLLLTVVKLLLSSTAPFVSLLEATGVKRVRVQHPLCLHRGMQEHGGMWKELPFGGSSVFSCMKAPV